MKTHGPQARIANYPPRAPNAEIIERTLTYSQITSSPRESWRNGEISCSQLIEKRDQGSPLEVSGLLFTFHRIPSIRRDLHGRARLIKCNSRAFCNARIKRAEKNESSANISRELLLADFNGSFAYTFYARFVIPYYSYRAIIGEFSFKHSWIFQRGHVMPLIARPGRDPFDSAVLRFLCTSYAHLRYYVFIVER